MKKKNDKQRALIIGGLLQSIFLLFLSAPSLAFEQEKLDSKHLSELSSTPQLPENIRISHEGAMVLDSENRTLFFKGKSLLYGEDGLRISAGQVFLDARKQSAHLSKKVSLVQAGGIDKNGKEIPSIEIHAEQARLNSITKTIYLSGNVRVHQGAMFHRCASAIYNYTTRTFQAKGLRSHTGPVILHSGNFIMKNQKGRQVLVADDSAVTTHDLADPNFWMRAERTTIYPDERIVFKNIKVYVGKVPVLWLPYFSQPLDAELGYHFLPGVSSHWGAYWLNHYGIMLGGELNEKTGIRENAWLLSQWHLDLRSRRGVGLGVHLMDYGLKENKNLTGLDLYYINDLNSEISRTSQVRDNLSDNRYKVELRHRFNLGESASGKTRLEFDIKKLSDRYYLEDFEPRNYHLEPNPDNEVALYHHNSHFFAGISARMRLNDFYKTDTRLPEIFIDYVKSPFLGGRFLYEADASFGIYREYLANFLEDNLKAEAAGLLAGDPRLIEINALLEARGFRRFHTWHELSMPLNLKGAINVVPHASIAYTAYNALENGGASFDRTQISLGADVSMKFSKTLPSLTHEALGLQGLMHVFAPYVKFSWLSTNRLDSSFRGIDIFSPTTRPRPLDLGLFRTLDSLTEWSVIRAGMKHELLTRRDGGTHQWLSIDTYTDFFIRDPEFNRDVSNLYNDISWHPLPWMYLNLETQFPILEGGSDFSEVYASGTFMPSDNLEISLGYRWLSNHPVLLDSERLSIRAFCRLNEFWGFALYHQWELNENRLEVQQYSVHYDFESWTAGLGIILRNNSSGSNEYGMMLNFTLKEFPAVRLPISIDSVFGN